MKIATWNIERLKKKKNLEAVIENIQKIDADILILTEFDSLVELPFYPFNVETKQLPKEPYNYAESERRVAVFSKFPIKNTYETYDAFTACCVEIETDLANVIVYGTIVGITGYSDKNFKSDLQKQINDIDKFSQLGNFCYAGDLNTSFADNYYFTHFAREKFIECFKDNHLQNITHHLKNNIDHIVISQSLMNRFEIETSEWNTDLQYSDHKGVCINLSIKSIS
ncbi:endonuclease/exonuclease/phosphatase family protein [Chryseobacterium oryzae]|uniref:Endonuclease/exonuclease/phosphatase family protein n=1 Tax=Chryseobacterium oryzae TaxID=2929799 RepID=A0ABY4BKA3_9FLAO|nr:endonuclease/exonuclease/phosphatase family protein [Chryseobacterium oryzae]UOE39510.1 endonuclease/exonuclease/phosphatase family protein [Chryseobacterium oryzae]